MRDIASMGSQLGSHALRIAIKDPAGNERVLQALHKALFQYDRQVPVSQAVSIA